MLAELGYPDEVPKVRARLKRLSVRDDAGVFVAELDGKVAACRLPADPLAAAKAASMPQITTLVVHRDERRRGLAGALVGRIESLAIASGCFRLEVTTQPHRRDAPELYLALGFHERPRRLVKPLASSGARASTFTWARVPHPTRRISPVIAVPSAGRLWASWARLAPRRRRLG
ncbi:MAG: GNAT family N-acetyltransferase [Solirubrobacteraceae bacterium]